MEWYKNDFDPDLPYRVISIETEKGFKYKIQQPLNLWIFGLSVRYYDSCEWHLRRKYKMTMYFKDQGEVEAFVKKQQFKKRVKYNKVVVFDSLKD